MNKINKVSIIFGVTFAVIVALSIGGIFAWAFFIVKNTLVAVVCSVLLVLGDLYLIQVFLDSIFNEDRSVGCFLGCGGMFLVVLGYYALTEYAVIKGTCHLKTARPLKRLTEKIGSI